MTELGRAGGALLLMLLVLLTATALGHAAFVLTLSEVRAVGAHRALIQAGLEVEDRLADAGASEGELLLRRGYRLRLAATELEGSRGMVRGGRIWWRMDPDREASAFRAGLEVGGDLHGAHWLEPPASWSDPAVLPVLGLEVRGSGVGLTLGPFGREEWQRRLSESPTGGFLHVPLGESPPAELAADAADLTHGTVWIAGDLSLPHPAWGRGVLGLLLVEGSLTLHPGARIVGLGQVGGTLTVAGPGAGVHPSVEAARPALRAMGERIGPVPVPGGWMLPLP